MFYSKFMFVKRGKLSKVWIAAHFHRKLNKAMVQGTDINISAKDISDPATPLALRLSGQLLLGLVRIYQRKVKYLQEDCSDALTKMKMVLRPGAVDLPPDSNTARADQITHSENYEAIEYAIPDIPLDSLDAYDAGFAAEGPADSGLNAPHLASISADALDITMDRPDVDLSNIDLLEDFADDYLAPMGDDGHFDDSRMVSDVEVGRATDKSGLQDDFEADFGADIENQSLKGGLTDDERDKSRLSGVDLSAFDVTTENEGVLLDITQDENVPELVEVQRPKARPKKRKVTPRDIHTELSSKVIAEAIKDHSDIVLEIRPSVSFRKKAKFYHLPTTLTALRARPSGLEAVSRGTLSFGLHDDLLLAPALKSVFSEAAKKRAKDVEEVEEGEEEEKKEVEQGLDISLDGMLAGEDFQFEDGGVDLTLDESTVMPPGENDQQEEKVPQKRDITYNDDWTQGKEVEEFFGEMSASQESKDEEEMAEAGWTSRTRKMQKLLARKMKGKKSLGLSDLVEGQNRKVAAATFYQLLLLKSHSVVEVKQPEAFGDIEISNLRASARAR